jgi:hypothetical protein
MPKVERSHSRSKDDALERAPPVYCEGDAVLGTDLSISVADMLMLPDAELEGVCMVIFIMLVVAVQLPEVAVYATEASLMDDIMPADIALISPLISGAAGVAAAGAAMDVGAADPQRLSANASAARPSFSNRAHHERAFSQLWGW